MAATSSLFGATAFAPQSAIEILRITKQLPVVSPTRGTSLDALAWGVGSANWQQPSSSEQPAHTCFALKTELRTLVAASFDVFMRLQRAHKEKTRAGLELAPEEIVRASREYREAVKTCIFAIEDRYSETDDELLDLLKVSLAMWHLCELLFLRRRPRDDKMLAYDLAAWLQEHYGGGKMEELDAETQRIRSLGTQHSAEQDTSYWPIVYALVATGSGAQAWSLLSMHSSFRSVFAGDGSASAASIRESFHTLQRLLLCMPGRQSRQQIEWQNWRDACQYFLTSDPFVRDRPEFRKLMAILAAESDALRDATGTWYDLMMARLVLEEPKAIAHRFEFLMANCFQTFHGNNTKDTMNNFDCIVLAILQHDVQSAVHDIYAMGFHWMSAHLTDLLSKANVVAGDEVVQQFGCSLQEYFMLQYVIDLTAYESTWQFTTTYFEHCPVYGLTARRSAVAVEPVTTNAKADRLLTYCYGKKGFQQTERHVSYRRAVECKNERAFASALQWALRGGHVDETDVIGELVLDECESSGSLSPLLEAVEFLDAHPELARTKQLKWLVTYRELNLVLEDRVALTLQLKEAFASGMDEHEQVKAQAQFVATQAAKRLQDLLASSLTPRRLRATLLTHVDSLLEETPAPFTSEQLFTVMEFLQSIERGFDRHEFDENPLNVKLRNRVSQQLSRHLSSAILSEGGVGSFRKSNSTAQSPHMDSSRSFAALTAGLQLLPETSSHALVDFQADASME